LEDETLDYKYILYRCRR